MSRTRPNSRRVRDMRQRLLCRDGRRCFYCRTPFTSDTDATLDHYIPYSLWRTWWARNLVLACTDCNSGKGDRLPWPLVWVLLATAPACPAGVPA
ncbi:HNH endonuclease [Streptomyces sp. PsTaAH-124]|uniref:HNH endonuclease n=1 Tax=Streptomyces sp. PsTaAH-124 TaxID=1157638 RepID=UPI00036CAB3D|nr:HNH endonuclease [Streptomyces sp. PsTaAH-124]